MTENQPKESSERITLVKLLQDFGDREVENTNEKVSTIFPWWKKAVTEYGIQARIEDLHEIKDSLNELVRENGNCCKYPVHEAAMLGAVKLIEFMLSNSYDLNTKDHFGRTPWIALTCGRGKTETASLFIQSSKDFGIELNAQDIYGNTAWHYACRDGTTEIAKLIIQLSKDFGIDLNVKDNIGSSGLHLACFYGRTETVQTIMESSKDFDINLNVKNNMGRTPFHEACFRGKTETVQIMIKNWKEFCVDIKALDNEGKTALDLINHCEGQRFNLIREMLVKEYSQIDVT